MAKKLFGTFDVREEFHFICPACGLFVGVATNLSDNRGVILHELPYCDKFLNSSTDAFLEFAIEKIRLKFLSSHNSSPLVSIDKTTPNPSKKS